MSRIRVLLFIIAVIVILGVIALFFPQPEVEIGGVKLHFASFENVIKGYQGQENPQADSLLHIVPEIELDSATIKYQDTIRYYHNFFCNDPTKIVLPDSSYNYFNEFFDALDSAQNELVHVMHYGDSQIEGDRITGFLRKKLQEKFGGSGCGLLPLLQKVQAHSVSQICSDSVPMFYAGGMIGPRSERTKHYGAMAQFAEINGHVNLNIRARDVKDFKRIKVFAGEVSNLNVKISESARKFEEKDDLQSATWMLGKTTNNLTVSFNGTASIYGISIDAGSGVSVSNIPMRGSDGTFLSKINKDEMSGMLRELNTRLIILEFGGNALPPIKDSVGVQRYCKSLKKQIDYMHTACPIAKILVIGPADMSITTGGELRTYKLLPYLVKQMEETCVESGVAFWNMYEVMGGYNSMISWVNHSPRWAAPDYIHFTQKGVQQIAEVLWESLLMYYDYYENYYDKELKK